MYNFDLLKEILRELSLNGIKDECSHMEPELGGVHEKMDGENYVVYFNYDISNMDLEWAVVRDRLVISIESDDKTYNLETVVRIHKDFVGGEYFQEYNSKKKVVRIVFKKPVLTEDKQDTTDKVNELISEVLHKEKNDDVSYLNDDTEMSEEMQQSCSIVKFMNDWAKLAKKYENDNIKESEIGLLEHNSLEESPFNDFNDGDTTEKFDTPLTFSFTLPTAINEIAFSNPIIKEDDENEMDDADNEDGEVDEEKDIMKEYVQKLKELEELKDKLKEFI